MTALADLMSRRALSGLLRDTFARLRYWRFSREQRSRPRLVWLRSWRHGANGAAALTLVVLWGCAGAGGSGDPIGDSGGAAGQATLATSTEGGVSAAGGAANSGGTKTAGGAGEAGAGGEGSFVCQIPDAPLFAIVHEGATLDFSTSDSAPLEVGTSADVEAQAPDAWLSEESVTLEVTGQRYFLKVFARMRAADCAGFSFQHVYDVRPEYDAAAEALDGIAIAMDAEQIVAWASGYREPVSYGSELDAMYQTPERALGPAVGDSLDIVGLGNGGQITLTFDAPIRNDEGPDFAVFENGFSDTFLELAFVEVSSNGTDFVRFDSAYLGGAEIGSFGTHQPTLMAGLAGKHRQGFGTPFDLELLRYRFAVQNGVVDLSAITHVRIVDIVGDGSVSDSFGQPIYDPTPTSGAAGFDLDAVAVLNQAGSG